VNLLNSEVIKTSTSDLRNGIIITMEEPGSRMYLVEGRKT